jgi:hypothetical protein
MITLVTTTRDRALCFGLLEKWMARQSLKWDQWIVVNDGTEPYNYNLGQTVLKRNPGGDDLPSICENWLAVMPLVQSSRSPLLQAATSEVDALKEQGPRHPFGHGLSFASIAARGTILPDVQVRLH